MHMENYRRKIKYWLSDDSVTECYDCHTQFSMFWCRKHHCRVCGKIFCYYCSNSTVLIPDAMISDLPKSPYYENVKGIHVRVCKQCNEYIENFTNFYNLIETKFCKFDMIKLKKYLPKQDISCIDNISDSYTGTSIETQASIYCLLKLREIQYKLPTDEFTELEKDLLWQNKHYFAGHSKWLIQILKIINYDNEKHVKELEKLLSRGKKNTCWNMMCTRNCTPIIDLLEIMDILHYNTSSPVINKLVLNTFNKSDIKEIILLLPFIATHLDKHKYILDYLISNYILNEGFLCELYWCVNLYNVNTKFVDMFNKKMEKINVSKINEKIAKMKELINFDVNRDYKNVMTPINPYEEYVNIDKKNIKVFNSASRPILIPFKKQDGSIKKILFKNEDIRKDQIVLNLINLTYLKLKKTGIIDTNIVTYKVSPITKNSGFIEIVDDATTIFNVTENLGFTLQNYIYEHNPNSTHKNILNKFMKSTAVYCILSYLLGFGDRHLDNIMIDKSGSLFHIDFSYILGKDPKYSNSKGIKITPEIINVMGGYNSKNYDTFKNYCINIYNSLRLYINTFMNMLLLVANIDDYISVETIRNELLTRFEVGESSLEAALHINTRIDTSGYTITDKITDVLHKSKKSPIISKLLNL